MPGSPTIYHEGRPAGMQRVHVGLDLVADDRELGERRRQDLLLEMGVAVQQIAQDGDQQEQQREQRQKAVVGQQRGEIAALVVDELVHDTEREAGGPVALLEAVEAVGGGHSRSVPTRGDPTRVQAVGAGNRSRGEPVGTGHDPS